MNKLDVQGILQDLCDVDVFIDVGNDWKTVCPFHQDDVPSMTVHKEIGLFNCFACGNSGSIFDLYSGYHNVPFMTALKDIANYLDVSDDDVKKATVAKRPPPKSREERAQEEEAEASKRPEIEPADILEWHKELMLRQPVQKNRITGEWGLSENTIKKFKLGFDGERITMPVYDEHGVCVNVRRYLPNAAKSEDKMRNYFQVDTDGTVIKYGTPARLYPMSALGNAYNEVILCEGEKDCLVLHEHGFNAVTATAGAAYWRSGWNEYFKDKRVYICYDDDEAGKRGAEMVANELVNVTGVYICTLPKPSSSIKGYDITDFFQIEGGTKEDFAQILADARTFSKPLEIKAGMETPQEVPLAFASMAKYNGKPIITRAFVSGKNMAPYLAPSVLKVQCSCTDGDEACATCPRWRQQNKNPTAPFKKTIELNSGNPGLLKLINCSETQQRGYLKEIAGIGRKCNFGRVDVLQTENIQQIILIPELDSIVNTMDEMEYVSRTSYYIGHDVIPNRSYIFAGTTQPDPRTQYATHVFDHKDDMQDSIRSFVMTPDIFEELRDTFQPATGQSIEEKLDDMYNFFWRKVHFIRGRPELQLGFDLVWHSVLNFSFAGQPVRKGWLEGLIIGDTSQGKTELTTRLRDYYNLGQRITGEKTSTAGLIGGLQKAGDQWILQWGAYPQNDRRALLIDEYSSLREEEIANMTDIRSTGVAEIVKIRTERTAARVRALLCSNLRSGELLRDTNQGINGVKELMGKNEDVRRLDFALTAATGEVPIELINKSEKLLPMYSREYSQEACHNLVLWAWSRNRPPNTNQVQFLPGAESAIRAYAQEMGKKYHPRIPLVEPSDQRLKIARMAVALACRLFSTNDGEQVIVTEDHVHYIARWLNEQYDKPSMAYNTWSETEWLADRFPPGVEEMLEEHIKNMPNGEDVVNFLARQNRSYRKTDLEAACNLDIESTKQLMYLLTSKSGVRTNGQGYRNQPCLNQLVRKMKASMPWPVAPSTTVPLPKLP